MAKTKKVDKRAALLNGAVTVVSAEEQGILPDVPEWVDAFPVLNAIMCVDEVDGKYRKTATITIWVEDCGLKCVLTDRQTNRKLWASAPSLGGLAGELEARLTARNPDWRTNAGTKAKGRS